MGKDQDQWIQTVLGVMVGTAETIGGNIARALPGNGDHDEARSGAKTKSEPHVTVITTPIVVHGKDEPPVIEIKKPINLKMDKAEMAQHIRDAKVTETAVSNEAEEMVSRTHQDMHNRIGQWFRHDSRETIDKMPTGPGDLTNGLVTALVGGITGVVGAAFPEVAVAMAAVNALEQAGQTIYVSDQKDKADDLKEQAKDLMNKIADEAEKQVLVGRDNALQSIAEAVLKLEDDPNAWDKFVEGGVKNVNPLAQQVASRWGTFADPNVLDKLEAKLHKILTMKIKRAELYVKLTKGKVSMGDAEREMQQYEEDFDRAHGKQPYQVDMTRPDYPGGKDPYRD